MYKKQTDIQNTIDYLKNANGTKIFKHVEKIREKAPHKTRSKFVHKKINSNKFEVN